MSLHFSPWMVYFILNNIRAEFHGARKHNSKRRVIGHTYSSHYYYDYSFRDYT